MITKSSAVASRGTSHASSLTPYQPVPKHIVCLTFDFDALSGFMPAAGVLDNWVHDFLYLKERCEWGVLTYTCHPFISGRGHRIMMLEKLICRLRDAGAVFQRVDDTVDEFKRRHGASALHA